MNSYLSKFSDVTLNNSKKSLHDHAVAGFINQQFMANGFETEIFQSDSIKYQSFRLGNDLPIDAKIVGMIARNHLDKNQKLFIEIANEILKNRRDVYFFVAGRDCTKIAIIDYLSDKSHVDNFIVMESVPSEEYLPVLDLYLSPSKVEGFPNVLAEAMLCGVRIMSTDVGDCKDIIRNYGTVFNHKDSFKELADVTIEMLSRSIDKHTMRKHIIDNFSIDEIANRHEDLYVKLINKVGVN